MRIGRAPSLIATPDPCGSFKKTMCATKAVGTQRNCSKIGGIAESLGPRSLGHRHSRMPECDWQKSADCAAWFDWGRLMKIRCLAGPASHSSTLKSFQSQRLSRHERKVGKDSNLSVRSAKHMPLRRSAPIISRAAMHCFIKPELGK